MGQTYTKMTLLRGAKEARASLEARIIDKQAEYDSLPFLNPARIELVREINFLQTKVAFYQGVIRRLRNGGKYLGEAESTLIIPERKAGKY